jgi:hypothetical protein
MSIIAKQNRHIPQVARVMALPVAIALAASVAISAIHAQTPDSSPAKPSAPASFSGCVQKAPGSSTTLVLSTPTTCAKLSGKFSVEQLAGHQIDLKGVLTPRTSSTPALIQVESVKKVGDVCSDVCSLQPPRSRGLHPPPQREVPGTEGGTPGAVPKTPQPQ